MNMEPLPPSQSVSTTDRAFSISQPQFGHEQTSALSQIVGTVQLAGQVFAGWKQVGKAEGLKTDADIARFLVQLYGNAHSGATSDTRCIHCQNFLTLFCTHCQFPRSSVPGNNTQQTGVASGGGSVSELRSAADKMVVSSKDVLEYLWDNEAPSSLFQVVGRQEISNAGQQFDSVKNAGQNLAQAHPMDMSSIKREAERQTLIGAGNGNSLECAGMGQTNEGWSEQRRPELTSSGQHCSDQPTAGENDGQEFTTNQWCDIFLKGERSGANSAGYEGLPTMVHPITSESWDSTTASSATGQNTVSEPQTKMVNSETQTTPKKKKVKVPKKRKAVIKEPSPSPEEPKKPKKAKAKRKDVGYHCREKGCSEEFQSRIELQNHIKNQHGLPPHRCPECSERFELKSVYHEHLRTHYRCEQCNISWIYKRSVKKHNKRKHENGGILWQCPDCGLTFTHKNGYNHHVRMQHSKEHKCEECDKVFTDYLELRRHVELHYKCEECKVTFSCRSALKGHMSLKHGIHSTKRVVCHLCGKSTTSLSEHMRSHTGARTYKCEVCHKSFRTSHVLRRHRVIHTGERPVKCHLCPGTFQHSSALRIHLASHGQQKRHKCPNCPKSFSKAVQLRNHAKTHAGETASPSTSMMSSDMQSNSSMRMDNNLPLRMEANPGLRMEENAALRMDNSAALRMEGYTYPFNLNERVLYPFINSHH